MFKETEENAADAVGDVSKIVCELKKKRFCLSLLNGRL